MNEFEEQLSSVLDNLKYLGNGEDLSILERIDENTKRIADALEAMIKLQIDKQAKQHALEIVKEIKREADGLEVVQEVQITTEEVLQDLKGVFIVGETPKSWVVTKNGHQKYVPFSKIVSPKYEEMEVGNIYDIVLDEGTEKWFHTKPWEKYTPYKAKKGG